MNDYIKIIESLKFLRENYEKLLQENQNLKLISTTLEKQLNEKLEISNEEPSDPLERNLNVIEKWPQPNNFGEILDFAKKMFSTHYGSWQIITEYDRLEPLFHERFTALVIVTGGWSENEAIIESLKKNIYWQIFSVAEVRGGMYILDYDKILMIK